MEFVIHSCVDGGSCAVDVSKACAVGMLAGPDMHGDRARSKQVLLNSAQSLGCRLLVGIAGDASVSVCDHACDAVEFQQATVRHQSCVGD